MIKNKEILTAEEIFMNEEKQNLNKKSTQNPSEKSPNQIGMMVAIGLVAGIGGILAGLQIGRSSVVTGSGSGMGGRGGQMGTPPDMGSTNSNSVNSNVKPSQDTVQNENSSNAASTPPGGQSASGQDSAQTPSRGSAPAQADFGPDSSQNSNQNFSRGRFSGQRPNSASQSQTSN